MSKKITFLINNKNEVIVEDSNDEFFLPAENLLLLEKIFEAMAKTHYYNNNYIVDAYL